MFDRDPPNAFEGLAQRLIQSRPNGWDRQLDQPPSDKGTHPPRSLNRNRATALLQFIDLTSGDRAVIGQGWLGISSGDNFHMPAKAEVTVLRPETDGTIDMRCLGMPGKMQHRFIPDYKVHNGACSEVAVLNALGHVLDIYYGHVAPALVGGTLYLLTERLPCASCSGILNSFKARYSSLDLHVAFLFESHERSVDDFFVQTRSSIEAYQIELISTADMGHVDGFASARFIPKGVSTYASEHKHEFDFVLNIVRRTPFNHVVPPRRPPSRQAGETSSHFLGGIASSGSMVARRAYRRSDFFWALAALSCSALLGRLIVKSCLKRSRHSTSA